MKKQQTRAAQSGLTLTLQMPTTCPVCKTGSQRHLQRSYWLIRGMRNVGRINVLMNQDNGCVRLWNLEFWMNAAQQEHAERCRKRGYTDDGNDCSEYGVLDVKHIVPLLERMNLDLNQLTNHLHTRAGYDG